MKTKFYFLKTSLCNFVSCLTLILSACSFNLSGQFANENITTGNDYFRDFLSRQVTNHTINIRTLRTDLGLWSTTKVFNSSCSGYSGNVFVADGVSPSTQVNTLEITPVTTGNRADFINGLTAADLTEITKYQQGLRAFNSWHMVAADVDNNSSITNNDKTVIQNLILGITNDFGTFGRNSWSWVPNVDIADFINFPFYNAYGDIWVPSIYFSGLSKNQIVSGSANYFKLHAIKNGDIISSGSGSGHNNWICGLGGYSLTTDIVRSRSSNQENLVKGKGLKKGDIVQLTVVLDQMPDSLGSLQIGFLIPNELSKIEKVEFLNGLTPEWHYNRETGNLVILKYYNSIGENLTYKEGNVMNIELLISKDAQFDSVISWLENFNQITYLNGKDFNVDFNLVIRNVISSSLDIKILGNSNDALINSPSSGNADVQITDISGKVLESRSIFLTEGINVYQSNLNLQFGMYLLTVYLDDLAPKSIKFIR